MLIDPNVNDAEKQSKILISSSLNSYPEQPFVREFSLNGRLRYRPGPWTSWTPSSPANYLANPGVITRPPKIAHMIPLSRIKAPKLEVEMHGEANPEEIRE